MAPKRKTESQPDSEIQSDHKKQKVIKSVASLKDTKRLIVVIEHASLETVKVGKQYELLNCDKHRNIAKKFKRDIAQCRPDITHQCLLMLMDSPLNRAGLLQVYIHTEKNVLIEINPQTRIPRTFDRFCGLMGRSSTALLSGAASLRRLAEDSQQAPSPSHIILTPGQPVAALTPIAERKAPLFQLLHKLSVHASDGPQKLLKVIKNPISDHSPVGCTKICTSFSADAIVDPRKLVPAEEPIVFVIGGMAHGSVKVDYTEKTVSISNYPLSAALTCAKVCGAFEEVWGVV